MADARFDFCQRAARNIAAAHLQSRRKLFLRQPFRIPVLADIFTDIFICFDALTHFNQFSFAVLNMEHFFLDYKKKLRYNCSIIRAKEMNHMPDYEKMYFTLFNAVTTAIAQLQDAQRKSEEIYIESDELTTIIFQKLKDEKQSK